MIESNTLNRYKRLNISLINSINIKVDYIGVQDNLKHIELYGDKDIDLYDKSTWKYYKNLVGEYHIRNKEIYIRDLVDDTEKLFTKQLLYNREDIREELKKKTGYYKELIERYPREVILINAIIFPTKYTIEELIDLEDGTIIGYNEELIEDNEYGLIEELSNYSKLYFTRWYNRGYVITDNLYIASVLSTLYSKLLLKLMNIRYRNIHTFKVHSFYVDMFFRNTLDLDNDVTVLNRDSKIWLYRNLRYIKNHIGKDHILQEVIDNLFTPNGVGVGEVNKITEQGRLLPNTTLNTPTSIVKHNLFKYKARNDEFIFLRDRIIDSSELLQLEDNTLQDTVHYKIDNLCENKQSLVSYRTKELVLDKEHSITLSTLPKINTAIDLWFSKAISGEYTKTYNYVDSSTGLSYTLTPKTGMLFIIKLLYSLYGYNTPISNYRVDNLIDYSITSDILRRNIYNNNILNRFIDTVIDKRPNRLSRVRKNSDIVTELSKINRYVAYLQLLIPNMNNGLAVGYSKKILKRVFRPYDIPITDTPKSIDELLEESGIKISIPNGYDHINSVLEVVSLFTGLSIDEIKSIDDSREHFKNILNKLTSYTVRMLKSEDNKTKVNVPIGNSVIDIVDMDRGLIGIESGNIECLDDFTAEFDTDSDRILYSMVAKITPNRVNIIKGGLQLSVNSTINKNRLTGNSLKPTVSIQIVKNTTTVGEVIPEIGVNRDKVIKPTVSVSKRVHILPINNPKIYVDSTKVDKLTANVAKPKFEVQVIFNGLKYTTLYNYSYEELDDSGTHYIEEY